MTPDFADGFGYGIGSSMFAAFILWVFYKIGYASGENK